MKNTLPHLVNYEMTIFDIRKIEKCFVMSVSLEPSNILRSKKAYGLEISESVLYVKDECCFSLPRKILHKHKKMNPWIS